MNLQENIRNDLNKINEEGEEPKQKYRTSGTYDNRKELFDQFNKAYNEFAKLRDAWIRNKQNELDIGINDEIYTIDSLMSKIADKLN